MLQVTLKVFLCFALWRSILFLCFAVGYLITVNVSALWHKQRFTADNLQSFFLLLQNYIKHEFERCIFFIFYLLLKKVRMANYFLYQSFLFSLEQS